MDLNHVPKGCRELISGFHDLLRQKPPSFVDTVRVEFNVNGLPNNVVHISSFCGEDGGIVELNVVSLVDTVFNYGRLVQMCHWCSSNMMYMDQPHSQGILLTCVVFSHKLSLTGQRRLDNFIWGKPTDVMLCQASTLLIQLNIVPTKGRKATELGLLSSWSKCTILNLCSVYCKQLPSPPLKLCNPPF
jgi:hypothetical protein